MTDLEIDNLINEIKNDIELSSENLKNSIEQKMRHAYLNTTTIDGSSFRLYSLTSAQSNVTNASSIRFIATFIGAPNNFTAQDVIVATTGSAFSGTPNVSVSTSNYSTFQIDVTGMDIQGIVEITIPAGEGITDASGTPNPMALTATVVYDNIAPAIVSLTPANLGTGIPISNNLVIVFDKAVQKGSGNIYIKRISDNTTFQVLDISSAVLDVDKATLTIAHTGFAASTNYYVTLAPTAIVDAAGNQFTGLTQSTDWTFATELLAPAAGPSAISRYISVITAVGPPKVASMTLTCLVPTGAKVMIFAKKTTAAYVESNEASQLAVFEALGVSGLHAYADFSDPSSDTTMLTSAAGANDYRLVHMGATSTTARPVISGLAGGSQSYSFVAYAYSQYGDAIKLNATQRTLVTTTAA